MCGVRPCFAGHGGSTGAYCVVLERRNVHKSVIPSLSTQMRELGFLVILNIIALACLNKVYEQPHVIYGIPIFFFKVFTIVKKDVSSVPIARGDAHDKCKI